MLYNIKSFSIEICVRDKTDTKRRFNLTSSVKEIESKNLYIKMNDKVESLDVAVACSILLYELGR